MTLIPHGKRFAFVYEETLSQVIVVIEGQEGYSMTTEVIDYDLAMVLNEKLGVDREMSDAMLAGSMFGWHLPACNPEKYKWVTS